MRASLLLRPAILMATLIVALLASSPVLSERQSALGDVPIQRTGRVDRVFTDQFFTVNDGNPGSDLPVFVPNPAAPPVRGDRVTVSGYMRPLNWASWVDYSSWFNEGWGLMQDMLVKFENRPVLVADSVIDPTGRNLALAGGQEAPDRPVTELTRGERKAAHKAEKAWGGRGMTGAAYAGTAVGPAGAGGQAPGAVTTAASAGTPSSESPSAPTVPLERVTPAGSQPDRRTGESAGEISERSTDRPGGTAAPGGRPMGPDVTSSGQQAGRQPAGRQGPAPGPSNETFVTTGQLAAEPAAYAGRNLVVSGTVLRQTGPRSVELSSGDGQVLAVELDAEPSYLVEGQRVLVHGRLMPHSGPAAMMSGHLLSPTGAAQGASERLDLDSEVVVATPRAIASDPALFVGRKVDLVAQVVHIAGPHAFVVRDDTAEADATGDTGSLNEAVLVLVSDPSRMPQEQGQRVRVVGRVVMPQDPAVNPEETAGRIDPAWLEGLDMSLYAGRPTILAESVTEPGFHQIGRERE